MEVSFDYEESFRYTSRFEKSVVVASKSVKSHLPTHAIPMHGSRGLSRNDASSLRLQQNLSKPTILDPVKHQAVKHLESANPPIPLPILTGCGHRNFIRTARQYIRDHNPDIIGFIETRISGFTADKIIAALRFPNSYHVEADGFSGGIWICCPHCTNIKALWSYLRQLSHHISKPWVILGDFNATLSSDKRLGCAHSSKPDSEFISTLFDIGLHDLGYLVSPFTWYKAHRPVRLDRCLCNSHWLEAFLDTLVHHLLCIKSDHRPLFVTIGHSPLRNRHHHFLYFAGWSQHDDFSRLLHDNWDNSRSLIENIYNFSAIAFDWNIMLTSNKHLTKKSFFGSKNRARIRFLLGIAIPLTFTQRLLFNRRRNRINSLQLESGDWCSDEDALCDVVTSFFQKLYLSYDYVPEKFPLSGCFLSLLDDDLNLLELMPTDEEIKDTLFAMSPLKSPGVDGFHTDFYQKH
ncbi:hypothetical protein V6N13_097601 [Hibiscus sabdariffa]